VRVVITGATGNVGSAVVRALERDSEIGEVVGVARRVPDAPQDRMASMRYLAADVARDDLRPVFEGADAVVHLAWKFQPIGRPDVTWEANAIGSGRVFDAAVDAGVRVLVHASSIGAYSPAPIEDPLRRVDESWPTHSLPTASYGREKAYAERLLDAVEANHPEVRVVRLRPAFTFQRRAAAEQRRIFAGPLVPDRLLRGPLPVLPLPSGLHLQAVHADDVADAYRRAVVREVRGAFNIAAEPVLDGGALARLYQARVIPVPRAAVRAAVGLGWHAHVLPVDVALVDLFLSIPLLDTTRARTELAWAPRHDGMDALTSFLEGLARHEGADEPLEPDRGVSRVRELTTLVGRRDPPPR
jgi:UDP-glucose 4-epimerase